MGGTSLMNSKQHRQRAAQLRQDDPNSRAATLHDMVANAMDKKEPDDPEIDELAEAYKRRLNQADVEV
jgi:hypothetical protein